MTIFRKMANFAEEFAINTIESSNDLRNVADNIDSGLKNTARQLEGSSNRVSNAARNTLTENAYAGYGARVGRWLSKPINLAIAVAGVVAVLFMAGYIGNR